MNVSVLGCGRWGTFLAWYARRSGHQVMLWGRPGSKNYARLETERQNEYLTLPPEVALTHSLAAAAAFGEMIVISVGAQSLREVGRRLKGLDVAAGKIFILCMKGLEADSGRRLSQVFEEETGGAARFGVWVGPGHVQDFVREIPNCMVVAAPEAAVREKIVAAFSSPLIRFYYGLDLLGVEIGAAAKNVVGLAAGMLDGLRYGSLKGALMARGARELSRLVRAMGGDGMTVYGLSHLGDYEATLFSPHSHNRRFGQAWAEGRPFDKLAEGVATAEALCRLGRRYQVELPICGAVYEILFEGRAPREKLLDLFLRPVKAEFGDEFDTEKKFYNQ